MRFKLQGKKWRLKSAHLYGADGTCCSKDDTEDPRTVVIDKRLKPKKELEIIIHEIIHAGLWCIDEEDVEETARVIADVLWRRGFRKG